MYALKESGYQYIGLVPIHWKLEKLKYKLKRSENRKVHSSEVLSLYREYGVVPKSSRDDNHNVTSEDTSKYKFVEIGDFVVNKMKAWQGSVAVSQLEGIVSPAYYVYSFIDRSFVKRYFHYLIRSCYKGEFRRLSGGIREGQWDLPSIALDNVSVICPPTEEQEKIANFLDDKCTEIDSLVADIQKEISILEDYKKAVIDEAVTKGIVPKVKMKKSGILWNEFYPSNWSIKKLKYITINSRKGKGITKEQVVNDGELPCVRYGEIYSKYDSVITKCLSNAKKSFLSSIQYAKKGDILFAATGELIEEIGKNVLFDVEQECAIGGDIIVVTQNQNPSFINYALNSSYCQGQKSIGKAKLKVVHISASDILNIVLFLPPISEQNRIVSYLDDRCLQIKKVITEKQSQLELLAEYKKSLIYEYVTGKKEVI